MLQRVAAYASISSNARGSADFSPRSELIATGKNVRYAASTDTAFQPSTPFEPRPMTTIGAIARIGTVCEATTYGRTPRSRSREWTSTTASPKPKTAPRTNPASASFAVNQAASSRGWMRAGPPVVTGSLNALRMSWMCGIVVSSTRNGHVQPVVSHSHL